MLDPTLFLPYRLAMAKKTTKERRDVHISVWLTPGEYDDIAAMAERAQDPPSTWLRKLASREKAIQAGGVSR